MFYCENTSDFVFKEGDKASSYFIIEKGECQVLINNEIRRTLKPGDAFGGINKINIIIIIIIIFKYIFIY